MTAGSLFSFLGGRVANLEHPSLGNTHHLEHPSLETSTSWNIHHRAKANDHLRYPEPMSTESRPWYLQNHAHVYRTSVTAKRQPRGEET